MLSPDHVQRLFSVSAEAHGFNLCGVAPVSVLDAEARALESWLKRGWHGKMHYMERQFEVRVEPRRLLPEARSVVVLSYPYYPERDIFAHKRLKVSRYAYGKDYHKVVKQRMRDWLRELRQQIGDFAALMCVDSSPVQEVAWAVRAGLGWAGKHSLLINKHRGSYFFLSVLLTDLDIAPNKPFATDHCGTCTRCVDACPTRAIDGERREVNAQKCISYLTIELKDEIPASFQNQMEGWIFGCDICQEVCPWNRKAWPHQEPDFLPSDWLKQASLKDWEALNEETFDKVFHHAAVKRAKFSGLKRNIHFALRGSESRSSG